MLVNRQDKIAAEYGRNYPDDADADLLEYAITNNNQLFLKDAFKKGIFDGEMLTKSDSNMFKFLIDVLSKGK